MPNIFLRVIKRCEIEHETQKKTWGVAKKLLWGDRIFCGVVLTKKFGVRLQKNLGKGVGVAILF